MADKVLHWHIPGVLSETGVVGTDFQGNAYRLDKEYTPTETWIRAKVSPQGSEGGGITIDINDDGVSIFDENPTLPDNSTSNTGHNFTSPALVMREGSVITLDVDKVGEEYPGYDLVVELSLDEA